MSKNYAPTAAHAPVPPVHLPGSTPATIPPAGVALSQIMVRLTAVEQGLAALRKAQAPTTPPAEPSAK
jgi:hypothetical protein